MLELVRHGLRQWNERAGGGDPGGGAAEGGADAGEAAAEPRGAGRGAGQRGTGRAEEQYTGGGERSEGARAVGGRGARPLELVSGAPPAASTPLSRAGPGGKKRGLGGAGGAGCFTALPAGRGWSGGSANGRDTGRTWDSTAPGAAAAVIDWRVG